jgi:predicted kinase
MKIIMTKGLPASGKSTWAKQYVLDNLDSVRINKDELRQMIHAGKWSKSNEQEIILARDTLIRMALGAGKTVIVDDTNFHLAHESRLRDLASQYDAEFEIKDFTDVPLEK